MIDFFCDASYSSLHLNIGIGIVEKQEKECFFYSLLRPLPRHAKHFSIDAEIQAIEMAFFLAKKRNETSFRIYTDCQAALNHFLNTGYTQVHSYSSKHRSYLETAHNKSRNYLHNELYLQIPEGEWYMILFEKNEFFLTTEKGTIRFALQGYYLTFLQQLIQNIVEKFPFRPVYLDSLFTQDLQSRFETMNQKNQEKVSYILKKSLTLKS